MSIAFTKKIEPPSPQCERIVWRVRKADGREAYAALRSVPPYGVELREYLRGELLRSRLFQPQHPLDALDVSIEKSLQEWTALGWQRVEGTK